MTAIADPEEDAPPKKSKLPLIVGLVLAIAGGGGGFMAVQMGFIGGSEDVTASSIEPADVQIADLPPVAYLALDPLVISLNDNGVRRFLRFSAQLEVPPNYLEDVESVKPRVIDVLNSYLRAVTIAELDDATVLTKLRGQMLRRIQVVVGEGRVRDLLIMEFVLN